MGIAFVFGLVVVLKSNVGLGAGGFVAALAVGAVIAPFVSGDFRKTPGISRFHADGYRVLFSILDLEMVLRPISCVRCSEV